MDDNRQTTDTGSAWYVYMVLCADDSLYTGITTDPSRRVTEHNGSSRGARYTRTRRPVTLVFQEQFPSRSSAAQREARIKNYTPQAKKKLAETMPPPDRKP
jgi:putative endonuclease